MRQLYEDFTRLLHALLALPMPLLALSFMASWFDYAPSHTGLDFLERLFWPVVAVVGLGWPSLRAWWRMCRGDGLMPRECLQARPAAAAAMLAACVLAIGIVVFVNAMPAGYFPSELGVSRAVSYLYKLSMTLSAVALLVGEWVLVGRDD